MKSTLTNLRWGMLLRPHVIMSTFKFALANLHQRKTDSILFKGMNPDYSSRKHKMSKRARHVESDQRVTGYPQKTAETRPG